MYWQKTTIKINKDRKPMNIKCVFWNINNFFYKDEYQLSEVRFERSDVQLFGVHFKRDIFKSVSEK